MRGGVTIPYRQRMSELFPYKQPVDADPDRPSFVDMSTDDATPIFKTLSSKTARQIFTQLHESPKTASDLAETVDTSLQNTVYHLNALVRAGLINIVDTWYSSRGLEMKVYAPRHEWLVLVAGPDEDIDAVTDAARSSTKNH